jgi:thiamine-monophosphate kinase
MAFAMDAADRLVQDLGEQGLLQRLQAYCPSQLIGDDGAVLSLKSGHSLVVTTDVLVDGVHFSDRTTSAEDVGWRAAAANLSDLAAMGAEPIGLTVGLSLPGTVAVDWTEALYRGLTDCLQPYGVPIVGGDVCRSPVTAVAITALGQVQPNGVIRRNTARAGDAIAVTGFHGASRAGLELMLEPDWNPNWSEEIRRSLILAHQRPIPRLDVIPKLRSLPIQRLAGMDSSDGLADAVLQICRASGVGAKLERSAIPMPPAFEFLAPDLAMNWTLYGGEDFELVLCLPLEQAESLVRAIGGRAAVIGEICRGDRVELTDRGEMYPSQILSMRSGFQHF